MGSLRKRKRGGRDEESEGERQRKMESVTRKEKKKML